ADYRVTFAPAQSTWVALWITIILGRATPPFRHPTCEPSRGRRSRRQAADHADEARASARRAVVGGAGQHHVRDLRHREPPGGERVDGVQQVRGLDVAGDRALLPGVGEGGELVGVVRGALAL